MSLVNFKITDLADFTREGEIAGTPDFHLFYVGRDDVHGVLNNVLSRVTTSLYLNMFGYDDDELNGLVMTAEPTRTPSPSIKTAQSEASRRLLL
jgi:hypothetical protein